ncbi:hypothetical protein HO173_002078 [Letharia columbiana]|uniref:Oxidoreductase molybdopterin-binding domain-containing protein n=1 Tax=Letharia columbiana TaxID=112416 RepID=A0A8H6G353_9LECA|nr:uncharacterized protein HO173_002078 [Letharia columbiana]KAF6239534.1 hypothetical protein HO173_002078 [Letharia columbiana]
MIKRSNGFNWGSGVVSCAYWRGSLLRDVLLGAGVPEHLPESHRFWTNFSGADDPNERRYETCISFQYGMDPRKDVIAAQFMNDEPLPPDHGHPVRVIISGYISGRWATHMLAADMKTNESKCPSTAVKPGSIVSTVSPKPQFAMVISSGVGYIGI